MCSIVAGNGQAVERLGDTSEVYGSCALQSLEKYNLYL